MPQSSDNPIRDGRAARASPGYALFQLARAFTTAEQHEDASTRERAKQRIAKWTSVWNGMLSGSIEVGSRTPVADVPTWATLEVVTGGFATGEMLAGGSLSADERAHLAELAPGADPTSRQPLNAYRLTETGLQELTELLGSGLYHVELPEHGALPVVAWLLQNGHVETARSLLDEIGPQFSRLRFYPSVAPHPRRPGSTVFLQNVAATIGDLQKVRPNPQILAQKEAIEVWLPLYDRTVALFLETVDGPPPVLVPDSVGKGGEIAGGWPCQHYPSDWVERGQKLLDEFEKKRGQHQHCTKPERAKENFAQLCTYLGRCVKDPASLTGRDVGRIRLVLARYVAKRGVPGSEKCTQQRAAQREQSDTPSYSDIANVLIARLAGLPADAGIEDVSIVTAPISLEEMAQSKVVAGTVPPEYLVRKVRRSMAETIDVLVDEDVITSGEVLARVLPQISSTVRAAGFSDPTLSQLYSAIYRAFRRRRSLLLLNLESQVQFEELPWVAAVERFRRDDLPAQDVSRQTLEEIVALVVTSFPHAIIPSKLLQELRALAKGAALDLPLVDELAADIFMGEFGSKFGAAAKHAAALLEGTLYERYYGVDFAEIRALPENETRQKRTWLHRTPPDAFAELCARRAGVKIGGWDPAINGMIIEQQQILTTQNLAVLFRALGLNTTLQGCLDDLARRCFLWVCSRQQMKIDRWHARLIMVKNTAYAWRQMVFFLALLPQEAVQNVLAFAREELDGRDTVFRERFDPVLRGLEIAASGERLSDDRGACRFLGWSKQKYWMLSDATQP